MTYLRYLCLFVYSGVQHILCFVFALFESVFTQNWVLINKRYIKAKERLIKNGQSRETGNIG